MAFSHVMLSQGRLLRSYPLITGAALAFNILVNWILIPLYGAAGAAITMLLTEVFLAILYFLGVRRFLGKGS
jgi:O-antigen/teichoic acid export membrane protein